MAKNVVYRRQMMAGINSGIRSVIKGVKRLIGSAKLMAWLIGIAYVSWRGVFSKRPHVEASGLA